jgi:transcriptional regulator with XRE-family HTH domain
MDRRLSLSERATDNLQRLIRTHEWGYKKRLAHKAGIPASSLTRILRGDQPVTLSILQAVQDLDGINPLQLLAGAGDELVPVTATEAQVLRYLRLWPRAVLESLVSFLAHFANEPPIDRDLRNGLTMLKKLSERQRFHALANMLMLLEGLPRDLEVALRLPPATPEPREATTKPKATRATRTKRTTTTS